MAKKKQLDIILGQGIKKWNAWRRQNVKVRPDLSGADFQEADLNGADLRRANLSGADLSDATLYKADLRRANLWGATLMDATLYKADLRGADLHNSLLYRAILEKADLRGADFTWANLRRAYLRDAQLSGTKFGEANLRRADLRGADLSKSDLRQADLNRADLRRANLAGADLRGVRFLETDLRNATVTGSKVFGISVWKTKLNGTIQKDLEINSYGEPVITVDNLEVAQFIYLLINNEKIREVIDTVTSKAVLILGRFTPPRKAVLEGVREELRQRNYLPIVFDFEKPAARDLTETISTLAHMVKFIIADLTDAKSIPQELQTIVPHLPSVPVIPLLMASAKEYGMFEHYSRYPWVLDTYTYKNGRTLIAHFNEKVIRPAEVKSSRTIQVRPPIVNPKRRASA
jgi:uncharacterized protein YjbI with pentapeptide repeats